MNNPKRFFKSELDRQATLATLENCGCDIRPLKDDDYELYNTYQNWAMEYENCGGDIEVEYQYWLKDLTERGSCEAHSDSEKPDVNPSGEYESGHLRKSNYDRVI